MKYLKTFFGLLIAILALGNATVYAATDGSLGATSTGTTDITLTIPTFVKISSLTNIALGSVTTLPTSGNTTACIYNNQATTYGITATSQNSSGTDFRLFDGSSNYITYTTTWTDTTTTDAPFTASGSTGKLTGRTGASSTSVACAPGGPNATFTVTVPDNQATAPASYSDTVTLLLEPA